jgi:hypothetical protein
MDGFVAIHGSNHVLEQLGYGMIRKTVTRGKKVLCAADQFEIHQIASMFRSPLFTIDPPLELDSHQSYTMRHIYDAFIFPLISHGGLFQEEFTRFHNYMIDEGYFPLGNTVLFSEGRLYIIDFSQYGIIQTLTVEGERRKVVHFPKINYLYPLSALRKTYEDFWKN